MGDIKNTLTFNLFAEPSFIEGIARIMDFSNSLQTYNYSKSGEEADSKALHSDWCQTGKDIASSISRYGEEK